MSLPLEHLSASSLNLFARCPRQWQRKYIEGVREPSNSSLIIGSAVHKELAGLLSGGIDSNTWEEAVEEAGEDVDWSKDPPDRAYNIYVKHVYDYWELVGKHLLPRAVRTEHEFSIEVPGVDIPIIGFIDLETEDALIDYKTTRYFSRKQVRLNPEWAIQLRIYQLVENKDAQIHVLTRSKTDPVIVPGTKEDQLYLPAITMAQKRELEVWIQYQYEQMQYLYENVDIEWPGNPNAEWAYRYCRHPNCCANLVK